MELLGQREGARETQTLPIVKKKIIIIMKACLLLKFLLLSETVRIHTLNLALSTYSKLKTKLTAKFRSELFHTV